MTTIDDLLVCASTYQLARMRARVDDEIIRRFRAMAEDPDEFRREAANWPSGVLRGVEQHIGSAVEAGAGPPTVTCLLDELHRATLAELVTRDDRSGPNANGSGR